MVFDSNGSKDIFRDWNGPGDYVLPSLTLAASPGVKLG